MNWIKRNRLIVFLAMIVVVMSVTKWKYGYRGEEISVNQRSDFSFQITPTVEPTPTVVEATPTEAETIDPEYPLWKLLPYSGKGFVVEKYSAPLKLVVTAKGLDKKLVEAEVKKWLESLGPKGANHKLVISN